MGYESASFFKSSWVSRSKIIWLKDFEISGVENA
jgi:hypothetical protein